MQIFMKDIRAAKVCTRGVREFFKRHGLDHTAFLKEGIAVEILEQINDAQAQHVIEVARGRRG